MRRSPLTLTLLALDRDARDDLLAALAGFVPGSAEDAVTLADLVARGAKAEPAIGEMDGWTILVDTLFAVPDQAEVVHRATRGRQGYAFVWQAASGSHGLGAHADGASHRTLFRSREEWVIDQGEPLPEETGLDWDGDPEAALGELASRLTGLDVDDDALWELALTPLRRAPKRSKTARALGG
jgi:hypothetical protein